MSVNVLLSSYFGHGIAGITSQFTAFAKLKRRRLWVQLPANPDKQLLNQLASDLDVIWTFQLNKNL